MARRRIAGRGRRGALDGDRAQHLVHRIRENAVSWAEQRIALGFARPEAEPVEATL
jgi:hypothetical protein